MRGCKWVTLSACLCMAEGMRTLGPWSPLHLSSASCLQRATRLYKFPALSCSPLSLHHRCSYIQSRMFVRNFPLVIKPLQACRWLCMCAYVTCKSAQEPGSAEVRRWLCADDRAGVRMRLSNMRARIWERLCFTENQTVRVKMRRCSHETGCVSEWKKEKGLIHSLPVCVWWVSQVLTKKNMYVFKSNTKHPFCLERSCLACLFCWKLLVRGTQETRRAKKNSGWHI